MTPLKYGRIFKALCAALLVLAGTINFSRAASGVIVNLEQGWARGPKTGNDTLINIQNIIGTQDDDQITGSTAANKLDGGPGNDVLDGGPGPDTLIGGPGNDIFVYQANGGIDYVKDFDLAHDKIKIAGRYSFFADIKPRLQQWGPNTVIYFDPSNYMVLENVNMNEITSDHMILN